MYFTHTYCTIQAMLDNSDDEQDDSDGKPVDMIIKDGVVYSTVEKPRDEETNSQVLYLHKIVKL